MPDAEAGQPEGFAGAYGSEHEGRMAKDSVETGSLKPDAGAGQREGFAAAYGSEHEGRDAKQSSG